MATIPRSGTRDRQADWARRGSNLLLAAVAAAFLLELVRILISPVSSPGGPLTDTMVTAVLLLPVLAFFLGAVEQPGRRAGWFLIGAGLVCNSIGEGFFYFGERTLSEFPVPGDFLCLALFPPLLLGVILLVRKEGGGMRLSIGLDGVIVALAVASLGYELIFNAVLATASASRTLVGGELAYPILDLATLTTLAVICIPSKFRVGGAYYWLMAGMAVLLATDVVNLAQTTRGAAAPSVALYVGWGAAIVLLSCSSRFSARLHRADALGGRLLGVAIGGAILLSLVLLVEEAAGDRNLVVISFASVALLLGLARLFRTLIENARLIAERDRVIAEQQDLERRLRQLANDDPLTGLSNRRRFAERVDEQLRYSMRYGHGGALLFMDLDSFKFINDSFGHATGDRVLRRVGAAIATSIRSTDTAARLGGDEFAVLLPETTEEDAMRVGDKILAAIKRGRDPIVGASAGIVFYGAERAHSADDLLIAADIALYEAKAAGHGGICRYRGQKGMKLTWLERIREAMREDRLVLYAQPIVDLRSGEIEREELLVRMIDRDGTEVPPESFLPTAERFGLIGDLDNFAVDRAIELARGGRAVAVNISGPGLTDRGLLERVGEAIADGMDPRLLSFELTETAGVVNIDAARQFAIALEAMGCDLALDDFGTGLSSLGYLKHIPIQTLKIDTDFVVSMSSETFDRYLVQTIVGLARRLGQKTVAEGVEDEATLALVKLFGVDFAQGFLLGVPAPIDPEGPRPVAASVLDALRGVASG
ncbi:MAG: EAL domain-containing protein [Solirubrobacterales bacterium]